MRRKNSLFNCFKNSWYANFEKIWKFGSKIKIYTLLISQQTWIQGLEQKLIKNVQNVYIKILKFKQGLQYRDGRKF